MRGSRVVLSVIAGAMILAASIASAEETLQISVDKTVSSGFTVIKFEGVTYRIHTEGNYFISFEKVDNSHHRVYVNAKPGEPIPYEPLAIQWGLFSPVSLDLDSDGDNSWLLGLETGYAEK